MKITHIAILNHTTGQWQVWQPKSRQENYFSRLWNYLNTDLEALKKQYQQPLKCISSGHESHGAKSYAFNVRSNEQFCLLIKLNSKEEMPSTLFNKLWEDLIENKVDPMTVFDREEDYLNENTISNA